MRTLTLSATLFMLTTLAVVATSWADIALEPDAPFKVYTVEDGLSQTLALTIAQDKAGYLWIGSFGGLNRFDGTSFDNLTTRHGLRENFIQELFVDSSDRLWAGDSSGGLTLIENSRVIMTIEPPEHHPGTIRDMYEHEGYLYMGLEPSGLTRLSLTDPEQGIELITAVPGQLDYIAATNEQELLLLGTEGFFRLSLANGGALERIDLDITALAGNPEQGIFVGNEAGQVGTLQDGVIEWSDGNYGEAIWRLFLNDQGLAWVVSQEHVIPYGRPDERFLQRRTVDMLFDQEGIVWLASSRGLERYLGPRFDHFSLMQEAGRPEIFAVAPDNADRYWFASDLGLLLVDASGQPRPVWQELGLGDRAPEIRSIEFADDQRTLWVAVLEDKVYRVDTETMEATAIFPESDAAVMGMTLDHRGRVWAGSYSGILYMHDPMTGTTNEFNMGQGASIYSPTMSPDGWLWFPVNRQGIHRLNTNIDGAQPELVIPAEDIGRDLFTHLTVSMDDQGEQTLWLTTVEGGVFRWRNERLAQVLNNSDLSDQTIYSIAPLPDNTLVLTTNRGAYRYSLEDQVLQRYGPLDGFVGIEGNAHATFMEDANTLWLGTAAGATRMDVSLPMEQITPPSATITQITANTTAIAPGTPAPTDFDGDKLLIEYVAISTSNPSGVEYSYRVRGANESWSVATSNRSIGFSSLAAGSYTFQVRARYDGGPWGPNDQWSFQIPTPFWQTYWFIGTIILFGLILTRAIVQLRLRAIARANQRLRREVLERTRSIEEGRQELEEINGQLSAEIFEREKSDAMRADVEARFHQAYKNSPIGMALVHLDGLVYDANPIIKQLFWPNSKPEAQEPLLSVIVDDDRARFEEFLFQFAAGKLSGSRMEVDCRAADGTIRRIDFLPSAVRNESDRLQYIVLLANDVTESRAMTRQLEYHASFDELTGLLNRRAYNLRLEAISSMPPSKHGSYLMYLDLDQFKIVNDTCGHAAGDDLLCKVAEIITNSVRDNDTVARLGGDEFALIMLDCTEEAALQRANLVRRAIQDFEFYWESQVFRIGVSIGVVRIDNATQDISELQKLADAACYAAKEAGRNRVHLVASEEDAAHEHRGEMRWVQRLNHAIETDSFVLFGQRLMSVNDQNDPNERIEILLRLNDRVAGRLIPPGAFLPAAERYGLNDKLDQWVVNRVIDVLTTQDQAQLTKRRFWVNLSGASVGDPNFSRQLIDRVASSGVPPGTLNFEITETAVIRNIDDAAKLVAALREMGCKFALDDFGNGLSSFSLLKRLELDFIKIDGEFIRDIVTDPTDRIFVKSIIDIAHTLDMSVVAEFVENDAVLEMVRDLGADYAQGFGVHRPEPLEGLVPAQIRQLQSGA